jgi:hypothetical protein
LTHSTSRGTEPIILAMIGLGLVLLFSPGGADEHHPVDARRAAVAPRAPAGPPRLTSERSHDAAAGTPVWTPGSPSGLPRPAEQAPASARQLSHLDPLISYVKRSPIITAKRAMAIKQMLRQLREQGAAAVPAIGDFLREGHDVDFATMSGGELVGHRTLRQAMIDSLREIGGSAAIAVSLEEIQRTNEPIELAMLARTLEGEEPGVHRASIVGALGDALLRAEETPTRERPDVGPVFDVLRACGGKQAIAVLERSVPRWGEYALIALAGLPDGAGIPSLVGLAATTGAPIANDVVPFQALAQATASYPEAGDALVDLTRAGQIPDRVWGAMSEALGGKHLQFSGKMFDGTPLAGDGIVAAGGRVPVWRSYYIEWQNVRYEQDVVSAAWSGDQVEQQLALIDDLLEATSSPAAVQALQHARVSLQAGRHT